jgi:ABC-2 type transport system permease protein
VNVDRIVAVILRQAYESRRNLDRMMDTLYWPVLDVFLWGFLTVYLSRTGTLRPGMVGFLLGGAILWGVFRAFQRDMTIGVLSDLWSRNLGTLFVTPLTAREYMCALLAVNLAKTIVGVSFAALLAWIAYAYKIFPFTLRLLPSLLNLILFAFVVGLVITGLILRFTTRIQGLTWSFTGFLLPVSCVFYPVSSLPRALRPVAWALPTTHAFEGMRAVLSGRPAPAAFLAWGLLLNLLYFAAAVAFFHWIFERARDEGLLVRQD